MGSPDAYATPLLPAKINRSAEPAPNVAFNRLAKAMVSGVKKSILESPFLVLGTMTFPEEMSSSCQVLCSTSLLRAPESTSIQTKSVNNRSLPILAASRRDAMSCSDDATYRMDSWNRLMWIVGEMNPRGAIRRSTIAHRKT